MLSCTFRFLALAIWLLATSLPSARATDNGHWGDQGDDTYCNPILSGDYSDPDPIRVGEDYYLATSTFQMSPGVSILHSRDLVNWKTLGAAIPDLAALGPDLNWDRMNRYNEGVYAPSLRYHEGKFWVFVNCHSGEGFYCCTASNPAGPWKVTQIVDKYGKRLRTRGWTDPCPFWDDDGKAYLGSSRPGGHWFGYLFEMTPDGTRLLDADADKMNATDGPYAYPEGGTLYSPAPSTEGNKLYKRNGYYYLVHIEFLDGGHGHGTYILRAKNLYGTKADGTPGAPGDPGSYDLLKFGDDLPGQGGFVDTPAGAWFWIGQFNRMDPDGRRPHLLPVTWIDDWPVPGVDPKDKKGHMVWRAKKPLTGAAVVLPQGGDEFDTPTLDPRWQWNHQPRADKWSLAERGGFLRLQAFRPASGGGFFKIGNILCQRHLLSERTVCTARLDLGRMADGQEAGLAHFNGGKNHAVLAVVQGGGQKTLKYEEDGKETPGPALAAGTTNLWLRSSASADAVATFAYSLDGTTYFPFGSAYQLKSGGYRGDLIGIYTFNTAEEAGSVDADWFHYEVKNR